MKYDIFISFKHSNAEKSRTRDSFIAEELYEYLTLQIPEKKVFFSERSLESTGVAHFKSAIESAIESCDTMIVVGTSHENINSTWVKYEWDLFHHEILSGGISGRRIFTLIDGISFRDLPMALRTYQSITYGPECFTKVCRFIRNQESGNSTSLPLNPPSSAVLQDGDSSLGEGKLWKFGAEEIGQSQNSKLEPQGSAKAIAPKFKLLANKGLLVVVLSAITVVLGAMGFPFFSGTRSPALLTELRREEIIRNVEVYLRKDIHPIKSSKVPIETESVPGSSGATVPDNSNKLFSVLTDDRVVDLRSWKRVPQDKFNEQYSAVTSIRTVTLTRSNDGLLYRTQGRTSGTAIFWECLSRHNHRVFDVPGNVFVGQDRMIARTIEVDVSNEPAGEPFAIKLAMTHWNSLQTQPEQWFGAIGYPESLKVSLLLIFPAGMPYSKYYLETAKTTIDKPTEFTGPRVLLEGPNRNWIYWEIPKPEAGRVYRLHWEW